MEISSMLIWYSFFFIFLAGFIIILIKEKNIRFLFYAAVGAISGYFVFDVPSVAFDYYIYVEHHYLFVILGVPISMALAEGFCAAIAIYVYEKLPHLSNFFKKKTPRNLITSQSK